MGAPCPAFAEMLVRGVVLLHVEHERYVHVLLETQQILDFARALLYEMIESIYHMSYSIIDASPTRGVPQARRLLEILNAI